MFHTVGCVACHAPQDQPVHATDKADLAALAAGSAPLGELARKFTVDDLAAFLRDPAKVRVAGRMPSLRLTEGESRAIATYLLRAQTPAGAAVKLPGLSYDYFEGGFKALADLEKATAKASGVADAPTLKVARRPGSFGLRFRGTITVPKDGEYTFYTDSDDGSALFTDEKKIVNNDGIHPPQSREGKVTLKAGDHAFGLDYFDGGGGKELKVSWKVPGLAKKEIPATVFAHDGQPPGRRQREFLAGFHRPIAVGDERPFVEIPLDIGQQRLVLLVIHQALLLRPLDRTVQVPGGWRQMKRLNEQEAVFLRVVGHVDHSCQFNRRSRRSV